MSDEPAHYVRLVDGVYANCAKGDPGALRVSEPVLPPPPPKSRWRVEATVESCYDDGILPMTVACEVEAYDEEGAKIAFQCNLDDLFTFDGGIDEYRVAPIDAPSPA